MKMKPSENVEVALGFGLGIPAVAFGFWLFAASCNFVLSSISSCRLVGSNFGLAGMVLIATGALVIVGSIAVLSQRKHSP